MPADLAVLGLGHTGLALAQAATAAGVNTIGYDTDPAAVAETNAGRVPSGTVSAPDLRRMLAGGFRATTDPRVLGRVRTAVVCVPTPLGPDQTPDLGEVAAAARALAAHLRPHTTVVLESAVYPGTTEGFLRPLLESGGLRAGRDFHLAYSPSRLDPGNRDFHLANTPKVVGGCTPACTEAAAAFYGRLTERVVRARGLREAETVKLMETNYRHVNIAFANEMAVFCHDLGVDLWDVIRCAETKPFGFQAFRPGPGVGGPAAALDPNTAPAFPAGPAGRPRLPGHPLRMVELAREVNGRMPRYVVQRAAALLNEHGKSLRGARVLLLGVTYKADLAEQDGAPAREIGSRLIELGAQLAYHDPYVPQWRVLDRPVPRADSLWEAAAEADLTLLLQHHRTYDLQGLAVKAQLMLDTRGATPAGAAARL
ncbi:nucleotide sugar dehydrogenase [Actinacidiphila sp. ITFR-21]|uniref:nucleotide sugar dehydrogenase n=1 Tax=Actinacidiphila sp. ITFR-21 TaxID=3075199 RepID=UPI00288B4F46|nr:nucleotide sugar dehydrogenase [Streptomyces sp. ITFR-21]WNI17329.1 nucleotide sugar dehydrogenase [Streptomyces sp. ITFR-21]